MWKVTHYAYCGMSIPLGDFTSHKEAMERVRARLRWFKRRICGEVMSLAKGREWELCEPDDCMMVPDACGILKIEKERVIL